MCKAYGGEPNVELLGAFLNLGPAGNWLTLSNRGETDVPKVIVKPFTHIQGDPLYRLIATYHVSVRTFPDPILYLASLKTSWEHGLREPAIYYHGKEMAFRSFMMDGIDGEFSFLLKETVDNKGASSPSFSINIEDSCNDDVLIDSSVTDRLRNWKVSVPSQVVEKRKHVVPKLSHRDLEKNPLILDFRGEIVTLQCQVERLHGEYSRIVLEEKKWVNYEQTLASLRSKVEGAKRSRLEESKVVSKVVPYIAMELAHSDKMDRYVAQLVKVTIIHGRCTAVEDVAALKDPFELTKMPGYRPHSKKDYDQEGNDLTCTPSH
ncbi:hypothetical protein Tco_0386682 [Tanacetum coccineum]